MNKYLPLSLFLVILSIYNQLSFGVETQDMPTTVCDPSSPERSEAYARTKYPWAETAVAATFISIIGLYAYYVSHYITT